MRMILSCFSLITLLSVDASASTGSGSSQVCGDSVVSAGAIFFAVSANDYSSFSCSSWVTRELNVVAVKISHEDRIELGVAVLSSDGSNVLASVVDGGEFAEGAIRSVDTRIDTDLWSSLGDNIFAVQVSWEGSSNANPYNYDVLHLYAMSEGKLVKILGDLMVRELVGAWDTHCEGDFIRRKMNVSVEGGEQAYRNLLVSEIATESSNHLVENKCVETIDRTLNIDYVLSHNGHRYVVPKQILAPYN